MSKSTLNIAAYGEGIMYPPNLLSNIPAIQTAGWTSIILGLFHISSTGDISFNGNLVIKDGQYKGDASWPALLQQLMPAIPGKTGNTITKLLASVGGASPVQDFAYVQSIYQDNNFSFAGTALQTNFQAFFTTFPLIRLIDMDVEDNNDQPSFVAFCRMLADIGFGLTFCPSSNFFQDFWTGSLAAVEQTHPGAVKWWNLQCYEGGGGNIPQAWADAITTAIPGFDTTGFILPGDMSCNLAGGGDCPPAVQSLMATFKTQDCVGGGFIWTIDHILQAGANCQPAATMSSYVAAISNGLLELP